MIHASSVKMMGWLGYRSVIGVFLGVRLDRAMYVLRAIVTELGALRPIDEITRQELGL